MGVWLQNKVHDTGLSNGLGCALAPFVTTALLRQHMQ